MIYKRKIHKTATLMFVKAEKCPSRSIQFNWHPSLVLSIALRSRQLRKTKAYCAIYKEKGGFMENVCIINFDKVFINVKFAPSWCECKWHEKNMCGKHVVYKFFTFLAFSRSIIWILFHFKHFKLKQKIWAITMPPYTL